MGLEVIAMFRVADLREPIALAPLGGGPSTPALVAAVCNAGALGQLASAYKTAADTRSEIQQVRAATDMPFGVNVLLPSPRSPVDGERIPSYLDQVRATTASLGMPLGEPRWDDDDWQAKVEMLIAERVPLVSFAFGCPSPQVVERCHDVGTAVWVSVAEPDDAKAAVEAGADALVVQGVEAGGHRATFEDREAAGALGLLALLRLVRHEVDVPLIAAGGIGDGFAIAAVLVAGASAAQLGTAFLRATEAGTSDVHRRALADGGQTVLTRAFTGRQARGIANTFTRALSSSAPIAYPHIHNATAPLRAAARASGDPEMVNLWAGQSYPLAEEATAGEIVERLSREWRQALRQAGQRFADCL